MATPFDTIAVPGAAALARFEELYAQYPQSGKYPFIIGDDGDLSDLQRMTEPPADGGAAIIAAAGALDVPAWLKGAGFKKIGKMASGATPQAGFATISDVLTGALKPTVHIGLAHIAQPWHLFAWLGYGDWNGCPGAPVHVALHKYWNGKFGSLPVCVSDAVVECYVPHPPATPAEALVLGGEQHAYCYDIVEQGFGSKARLAASLLGAKVWYFWWD